MWTDGRTLGNNRLLSRQCKSAENRSVELTALYPVVTFLIHISLLGILLLLISPVVTFLFLISLLGILLVRISPVVTFFFRVSPGDKFLLLISLAVTIRQSIQCLFT
jgi:hypothetical protein